MAVLKDLDGRKVEIYKKMNLVAQNFLLINPNNESQKDKINY